MADDIERVPLLAPFTQLERLIVDLLATGKENYWSIGELLDMTRFTVKWHAKNAANKIPGDLPPQLRMVVWVRGGSYSVLGVKTPHKEDSTNGK